MFSKINQCDSNDIDAIVKISGLHSVLQNTKAYMLLNVCVHNFSRELLPKGYDTYILGFWHEVFDEEWFQLNYQTHKDSQFIILSDLLPNGLANFSRVKSIRMLHWKYYTESVTKPAIDWANKKYKISSLSYFVKEFRYFITAALLDKEDALVSWHNQDRSYGNYEYIFEKTGYPRRDRLLKFRERLKEKIEIDSVYNDPEYNYKQSVLTPAYSLSLVNCINETKDVSWVEGFGDSPGPYLTEKTWKALYSGVAMIFTGQLNTKFVLKEAGFNFDYPWSNSYADIPGDLERLEKIIETADIIIQMPFDTIVKGIQQSCEHNKDHLFSASLENYIDSINKNGLEELEATLK